METRKIAALHTAINLGSISKASEKLGYSQSGMTYMINSLEEETGILLLQRNHNGITLTKEGEELEPFIKALLDNEKVLLAKASEIAKRNTRKLRIGAYSSIATYWLPEIIKEFKIVNPNVDVEIFIGTPEIPSWLKEDIVDIALGEEVFSKGFEWIKLKKDIMCAVVPATPEFSPDQPVSLEKLAEYPMLFPVNEQHNTIAKKLLRLKNDKNLKNMTTVSTSSADALLFMVKQGLGVTFMSNLFKSQHPENVLFLRTDPPTHRWLGIIAKPHGNRSLLMNEFIAFFKRHEILHRAENDTDYVK
jgi:DNA-binding transcriptional LysR family regulator